MICCYHPFRSKRPPESCDEMLGSLGRFDDGTPAPAKPPAAAATVTIAMTPEVRAIVDQTTALHAEVAAELREMAGDIDWMREQCVNGDMRISAITLGTWSHKTRALAAKLAPEGGTDG